MNGHLFIYDEENKLVAFQSGSLLSNRFFIFLGGLSDGFLCLPYLQKLSSELENKFKDYSLVQVLLRSSYFQYGWHSIDNDIEDLQKLINYLIQNRKNLQSIVLMGHSTGCQDIIHYLRQEKTPKKQIIQIILQGPVSDRQYLTRQSIINDQLKYCYENQSNPFEWLPRSLHFPPLTINRCQSLIEKYSVEDLFSSDLSDEDLKQIYQNIEIPIAWIWSKKDQYVPDDIKDEVMNFVQNKLANRTNSSFLLLEEADHFIHDEKQQNILINFILHVLSSRESFSD